MTAYTVRVPFAGEWLTANPRSSTDRYGRAAIIRQWRGATVLACRAAKLPTGITPVRIRADVYYVGRAPVRDSENLRATTKACVDGLTPAKVFTRKGQRHVTVGYGLLPDDSDRHVLSTTLALHRAEPGEQPCVVLTITHEPATVDTAEGSTLRLNLCVVDETGATVDNPVDGA